MKYRYILLLEFVPRTFNNLYIDQYYDDIHVNMKLMLLIEFTQRSFGKLYIYRACKVISVQMRDFPFQRNNGLTYET